MFTRKDPPKHQKLLESELERALRDLRSYQPGSQEYTKVVSEIKSLNKMLYKPQSRISSDTRATIAANLLGILMIIKHEHVNNITSKALSFVIKTR